MDGLGFLRIDAQLLLLTMTKFRPCIDLHEGQVKQIVGGTLRDDGVGPTENHVSEEPPSWFAEKFRNDAVTGGHVIMLGPGNEAAAKEALASWPGGLQIGGGIRETNAAIWLEHGASHVIVTSWLFDQEGAFLEDRLKALAANLTPSRIVVDLSCRRTDAGWQVAMNRWQTLTDLSVDLKTLDRLAPYCDEFLIHAADVEGKCGGIDRELVKELGRWEGRPVTYAGGAASLDDLRLAEELSGGKVDVTIGSALDLFGGSGVKYAELVAWNRRGV
jgi:phosphoribosylformimino-5-aminoimidazole carboxamide ribotide isomerase